MLERIPRRRLVDEAATAIRKAIIDGTFKPGDRLPEDRLATMLGVSRTPLREAFRMLEEEGLVAVSTGRGVEVVRLDTEEASDLYDVREVLDGLAARRAADRIRPESLQELLRLVDTMHKVLAVGDFDGWLQCNVRFHEAVAEASGNRRLLRLLPAIRVTVQMFHPILASDESRPNDALREHETILAAIRRRDGEAAEAAARMHIRNAKAMLLDHLKRTADTSAPALHG